MITEFVFDANSCCPWTLDEPLFLWQGETMRAEADDVVVERLDGTIVRHLLAGRRRG